MKAPLANVVTPTSAPAHEWNWRADLKQIDVTIEHVGSGDAWNWRGELAALEAELDGLAERLGL